MQAREWSMKTRLVILSTVAVLGLAVLGFYSLDSLRHNMLQDRKDETQVLVEIAGGVITRFTISPRAAR